MKVALAGIIFVTLVLEGYIMGLIVYTQCYTSMITTLCTEPHTDYMHLF